MPRFLIEIALEPLSAKAQARLYELVAQAPEGLGEFRLDTDKESGQSILCCQSQQQVTLIVNWLRKELELLLNVGQPQVAYRETLGEPAEVVHINKRQLGGVGQSARVTIRFEPLPRGGGEIFENATPDDVLPKRYIPGVEKGLRAAAESGLIAGFPVIDYKATLIGGGYHETDSSPLAFEIAARGAFRQAGKAAKAKLLEPIMTLEVVAPSECAAPILRDLRSRRAGEATTRRNGADAEIFVDAPLANLFEYEDALARITEGRGRFRTAFARYAPIPETPPNDDDDRFPPAVGKRA